MEKHRPLLLVLCLLPLAAFAGDGRLLATGGAGQLEGSAGGGLVPWAVIGGYATDGQWSATGFLTHVDTGDYSLASAGVAATWSNRVELSIARHTLEMPTLVDALSLPRGSELSQNVLGVKVRLHGNVVYSRWPQVSFGVQHKRNRRFEIPAAVGARSDEGTDLYLSAAKLFLAGAKGRNLFLNTTLRRSKANQLGLLGFGGDRDAGYSVLVEASAALFLDRKTAVGIEYRQKPDNLSFAAEDDWKDVFIAYFPSKRLSLVAAWAELGAIATIENQNGIYLSLQGSF